MLALLRDPPRQGVLLFDAADSRTMAGDLVLSRLKTICLCNPKVKLVVTNWPGPLSQLTEYLGSPVQVITTGNPTRVSQVHYQKTGTENYLS